MIQFIKFDPVTGQILLSGRASESMLRNHHVGNMADNIILDVEAVSDTHYVNVQNRTLVNKPPKPSTHHYWDYQTKNWILNEDMAWMEVRGKRNAILGESDWTQLPDVPLATKEAWADYRQMLRDVTNQNDPLNIVWPVPPSN